MTRKNAILIGGKTGQTDQTGQTGQERLTALNAILRHCRYQWRRYALKATKIRDNSCMMSHAQP